jgi:uncharacterized protein
MTTIVPPSSRYLSCRGSMPTGSAFGADPRIKVVIAQVPAIFAAQSLILLTGRQGWDAYLGLLAHDHAMRNVGMPSAEIPIVGLQGEASVLATADSHSWFVKSGASIAPNWLNRTSLESVARLAEYGPGAFIDMIAPKALMIQAATEDTLIPIAQVREAFTRAGEPKKLVEHQGGHFDLYPGERLFEPALARAVDWFKTHL